jgi:hypothetical protein
LPLLSPTLRDMASSSTNLGLDESPRTIEDLLREFEDWSKTADRVNDDFDLVAKTAALYRFAIAHFNDPGSDLLLKAIAAFEAAESA